MSDTPEVCLLSPVLVSCENLVYRICGVDRNEEMDWKRYAWAMILFNLLLFAALFVLFATMFPTLTEAITGETKKVHTIHQEKCISCGACYDVCPTEGAIRFFPKKQLAVAMEGV